MAEVGKEIWRCLSERERERERYGGGREGGRDKSPREGKIAVTEG